jgi:hypothetical protein
VAEHGFSISMPRVLQPKKEEGFEKPFLRMRERREYITGPMG